MANSEKASDLKLVVVRPQSVKCPHCNEDQDGWIRDPRGGEYDCDECGKKYAVAKDAEIKFF